MLEHTISRQPEPFQENVESLSLGVPETITSIPSLTPDGLHPMEFRRFSKEIILPPSMVEGLRIILNEYTQSFDTVVKNRQGTEGYGYAKTPNGNYVNFGFQIDMAGLPTSLLTKLSSLSPEEVANQLRPLIFEIENSLAMYNLMRGFTSSQEQYSPLNFFGINFDTAIKAWEEYTGLPLALGAVTEEKFRDMMLLELGITNPREVTPELVRKRSGFANFFSPQQLKQLALSKRIEEYLLYMRTSYPRSILRKPNPNIQVSLLENTEIREAIRRQTITFNVDDQSRVRVLLENLPNINIGFDENRMFDFITHEGRKFNPGIINDTKEPMVRIGLAYPVPNSEALLQGIQVRNERGRLQKGWKLNQGFANYLRGTELLPEETTVRAKPLWLSYGGYGHIRGTPLNDKDFRHTLRKGLKQRGPYCAQPEIPPHIFYNADDGHLYASIFSNIFLLMIQDHKALK